MAAFDVDRLTLRRSPGEPEWRLSRLGDAVATGVGSLPHRSAKEASLFALANYELPAIPSLPRRSPAEAMVAQAVLGIGGVTTGQYGGIAVDATALDPAAPVVTDLAHDAYRGLRSFIHRAQQAGFHGPVKWQFVGPVTLGMALLRAGVAGELAFEVAGAAVRAHLETIDRVIAEQLPDSPQVVICDEPWFGEVVNPGFPIAPDQAVDLLSGAMAAVPGSSVVGVHCCGYVDLASLLAAGPAVVSIPARAALVESAGYIDRFLAGGGRIAWGVAATDGPVALDGRASNDIERGWRRLRQVWTELARRGVDPDRLRTQSLLTPDCGLAAHSPSVALRVCSTVRGIGERARHWSPESARAH